MVTQVCNPVWDGVGSVGGLLLRQAVEWRQAQAEGQGWETVATGFPALDRLLPAGGVRRGSLIEWLADGGAPVGDACGAVALACAVACRLAVSAAQALASQAATIVVVDRGQRFYPPAVIPWLDAQTDVAATRGRRPQLVVARPSRDDDEIWAIDQALRCPGVAAVLAWPERVHSTAMRRWQLASRASGAVGLLVRGLAERQQAGAPTWADARVAVAPVAEGDSVSDFAVRRLRIARVGGPWSGNEMRNEMLSDMRNEMLGDMRNEMLGDMRNEMLGDMRNEMLGERSTELRLDLTNGRESTRRHRLSGGTGTPSTPGRFQDDRFPVEGAACRAS